MKPVKYNLYYKNQKLGSIQELDYDFPNMFGKYQILPAVEKEEELLFQYIQYSVRVSIMMETDDKKCEDFMQTEESRFTELIESEDWFLIDESGKTHKILIPNFCKKNGVVWRWSL